MSVSQCTSEQKIARESFYPHLMGNKNSQGFSQSAFSLHLLVLANHHSVIAFFFILFVRTSFERMHPEEIMYELILELSCCDVRGEMLCTFVF